MLIMSNIGDQVWLMTSRQTEPLLLVRKDLVICFCFCLCFSVVSDDVG